MRCWLFLIVAAIVVAYQMQETEAKFSFSLPGRWGGAKRGGSFSFSLPGQWGGQGKRGADMAPGCESPEEAYIAYRVYEAQLERLRECMGANRVDTAENEATEKH